MSNKIDEVLETAFSKLKTMIDTDTIVGKPIKTEDGSIIIPVTKVTVGFVAGGGEYSEVTLAGKKKTDNEYPFAGGSGSGMTITPVAFVVVSPNGTEVFGIEGKTAAQKLFDVLPDVIKTSIEKLSEFVDSKYYKEAENEKN